MNTHKYQCGIRLVVVFLDEIVVILVGFMLELLVELDVGTWIGKGWGRFVQTKEPY